MVWAKIRRSARRKKFNAELEKMKADINRLEATISEKKADVQMEFKQRLDELHDKAENVQGRLKEMEATSGLAWNEARRGVAKAFHELESACHRASEELKNR